MVSAFVPVILCVNGRSAVLRSRGASPVTRVAGSSAAVANDGIVLGVSSAAYVETRAWVISPVTDAVELGVRVLGALKKTESVITGLQGSVLLVAEGLDLVAR